MIGDGGMSTEVMAVRELNTDPQNNERAGRVQNMWVNVAGPRWHLSHSGSMVGSIRASLHFDQCSLYTHR